MLHAMFNFLLWWHEILELLLPPQAPQTISCLLRPLLRNSGSQDLLFLWHVVLEFLSLLHAFFNFLLLWHEILEPLLLCHANVEILLTILVYGQSEAALQAPQEPIGRGLQLAAVSRAQRRYAKGLKVQQKVQQSQHERAFVAFLQIAADSAAQAAEAPQVKQGQEQGAEEEGAAEAHPVQEEEVKQEEEDCSDVEEIKKNCCVPQMQKTGDLSHSMWWTTRQHN